jgi:tetratricopeptide (TPR) repeat protein
MRTCILFLFLLVTLSGLTQVSTDQQLAQYYYSSGDFEKALPYCQQVFLKENSKFTFIRYYTCLLKTKKDRDAEKVLKKQMDFDPYTVDYPILLAEFYETHEEQKAANKIFQRLIEENATSSVKVLEVYKAFKEKGKFELCLQILEKGRKNLEDSYPLHLQFADVYAQLNQNQKMVEEYLDLLEINSEFKEQVQTALAQRIDFTQANNPTSDLVKEALIDRSQSRSSDLIYAEMLQWYFTQRKQFALALTQAQALDKRENNTGYRVYELASVFAQNKDYVLARKGYEYVLTHGKEKGFHFMSENAILHTYFLEVTEKRNLSVDTLQSIITNYKEVIQRLGKSRNTITILKELAQIQGLYANQVDEAITLLREIMVLPGLSGIQVSEIKMVLADFYVLKNEIWEASLLYMQIDNDYKFETIGFEAKFKNARVFYYDGDFQFAQSQLDILKQSTSKLIANDALKLSLLITDNYGLDSNYTAMHQFAQADLLLEQHKYNQAFVLYDSILTAFPYHGLTDEILLRKAQAFQQQGNWKEAILYLEKLLKSYSEDILADDALFQLGDIYENHLGDKEKAIENYKKIIFQYKGSLYVVEARKRLRMLRGDKLDIEDQM